MVRNDGPIATGKFLRKRGKKDWKSLKNIQTAYLQKILHKKIKGKCRPKILPAQKSVRITDRNSASLLFKSFLHLRLPVTILSFEK